MLLPRGVTTALTILIGLVWAGNVVVGFINPALRDPMINAIFAIVVGSLYALRRKDNAGPEDRPDATLPGTAGQDRESTRDGGP